MFLKYFFSILDIVKHFITRVIDKLNNALRKIYRIQKTFMRRLNGLDLMMIDYIIFRYIWKYNLNNVIDYFII